jgi:dTDP-glucose pyrophosphorylase/predicted transcriptional regulator
MTKDLSKYLVDKDRSIHDTIRVISQGAAQIALVVDSDQRLLGTVTDGDIRRGLLKGETLKIPIERIMHREFRSLTADCPEKVALSMMRKNMLRQIPGLDEDGRVIRLFLLEDLINPRVLPNWVVIMAGGEGKRLRPMTNFCPKPMLQVGGKPILEIILEHFEETGFRKFFFSVNYLKQQIKDYFGNGEYWNVEIEYVDEQLPLGTAGALSLLPQKPEQPILVINGDVLTRTDYVKLLQFHDEYHASATVCVRKHETMVPFGVVETKGTQILSIEEKPVLTHFLNAGIYALNPEILELLSPEEACDMPQLLEKALKKDLSICAFPIHEYWLDVGHPDSYKQANGERLK